ncbi:MAG: CvpA family protein [Chitinophagaceae bacterium]
MTIDVVFAIIMLMAVIKGYQKGFIVAVFSVIALFAGLVAAIKFSTFAADWLKNSVNVSAKWLPVVSFVLVFLLAVLLVRLGAKIIEKTAEFAMLGWINRLAGIVLYALLYTLVFSVILFYAEKIGLLGEATIIDSKTAHIIRPLGPWAIDAIGSVMPFFKNMFHDLGAFFETIPMPEKSKS